MKPRNNIVNGGVIPFGAAVIGRSLRQQSDGSVLHSVQYVHAGSVVTTHVPITTINQGILLPSRKVYGASGGTSSHIPNPIPMARLPK